MEAYGIGKGRNLRGGKAALRELHRQRASSPHREKGPLAAIRVAWDA
jgi:hypothetical protein